MIFSGRLGNYQEDGKSDVRVPASGKRQYRGGVGLPALAGSAGEPVTAP